MNDAAHLNFVLDISELLPTFFNVLPAGGTSGAVSNICISVLKNLHITAGVLSAVSACFTFPACNSHRV